MTAHKITLTVCAVMALSCGGDSADTFDSGAPGADSSLIDAPGGGADATGNDGGGDATSSDGGSAGLELVIEQISIVDALYSGESALVIGPDGTSVLIDVGRSNSAPQVREAIDRRIGSREIDWLVLTHYHVDHIAAVDNLFSAGDEQITINRGVITRGLNDVGADIVDNNGFEDFCALHESATWAGKIFDLCSGPSNAPCDGTTTGNPWTASACAGLTRGDLEDPGDDDQGRPSYLDLGGGARLTIYHGNGRLVQNGGVVSAEAEGVVIGYGDTENENGRSLGGTIRWGDFNYVFAGDLTGAGAKEVPDVEGFIAARSAGIVDGAGGAALIPPGGLDVAKLSHHGLRSATQQPWADWLFPADGEDRNAVVGGSGISTGYSPSQNVVDRIGPRVGSGHIWVTHPGLLAGGHDRRLDANGAVVIEVTDSGDQYQMFALTGDGPELAESYTSVP